METLKHECGIAIIRLLKPLQYYKDKYGTEQYGLNKLYLLMEKQHNRGQEGAGVACLKLNADPGQEFMFRERATGTTAITQVFERLHEHPIQSNVFMGHLRYSTTGRNGLDYVHPFLRRSNWRAKNLALCGNFNLTNVDEVFQAVVAGGQHPRRYADTYILLEQVGHRLDREFEHLYSLYRDRGLNGLELTTAIEEHIDLAQVLRTSSPLWDGGYVMCGLTGSGETFTLRDPWGIRSAFWYKDDEVIVVASERPVIQTVFDVPIDSIHELEPGQALFTHKNGSMHLEQINAPKVKRACSFERIYFSRGSDADIYNERKELGRRLVNQILPILDYDIEHTVFSYIPNTAEVAYYGLMCGLEEYLNEQKVRMIEALGHAPDHDELERILSLRVRCEKVAIKDIKLRTFISEGVSRNDMATHVYDVSYGSLKPYEDNLVIIDDSIVRGTTLKQSIIKMMDRLHPKKTVIVSSAPQVRYPDYYGIDMSSMDQFIAFKAALALLRERGMQDVIDSVYEKAKLVDCAHNPVKEIYAPFSDEEISGKICSMLTPAGIETQVEIVYQSVEGLHEACPNHLGDWYFTGDYPTPGGLRLQNRAFVEYIDKEDSGN